MDKKKVIVICGVTFICIAGVWYLEKNYQISKRMQEKFGKGLPGKVTEPLKKEEVEEDFDDDFFDDVEDTNPEEPIPDTYTNIVTDNKSITINENAKSPFNIMVSVPKSSEPEKEPSFKSKGVIFHSIEEMRENIDSFKEGDKVFLQIGNTSDVLEYVRTKDGFEDANPQSTDEGIPVEELSKSVDIAIVPELEEKTGTGKN